MSQSTPARSPGIIRRAALEARLDEAFGKRLTTVVAGAGFGKTMLLDTWRDDVEHVWLPVTASDAQLPRFVRGVAAALRPRAAAAAEAVTQASDASVADTARGEFVGALLCEELARVLQHDLVLVLDDLHELPGTTEAARLVEAVCRQAPPPLHIVVAARRAPPIRTQRLRARGDVLELTSDDLRFSTQEASTLVRQHLGPGAEDLAESVHSVTGGWPAAVTLVLETLAAAPRGQDRLSALERAARHDGPLFPYLAEEVFANAPADVRALLGCAALFDRVTAPLCAALGHDNAASILDELVDRGLAQRRHDGWFALHALVRNFVQAAWPLEEAGVRRLRRSAARWLEEQELYEAAADQLVAAGARDGVLRLLRQRGARMLQAAGPAAVLRLEPALRGSEIGAEAEQLLGEAHMLAGEPHEAVDHFRTAARGRARIPVALAANLAAAYHLEDRLEEASAVEDAADLDAGTDADRALLFGWLAGTAHRLGRRARVQELANRALAAAAASGDDRALALAHTSLGLVSGDARVKADSHLEAALEAARRSGDAFHLARVHNNRGSHLLERGEYDGAIAELDEAMRLAEVGGFRSLLALATMNRGLCHWCLGRLDEANADYDAAVEMYRGIGSKELAYALIGRGDVHRERGDLAQARAAYEQGLALGEQTSDRQALVPALYQLAKVVVDDDPERAEALARQAVEYGWPDLAWALNALGWVLLARGAPAAAAAAAARAADAAAELDDPFGLAESLELRAAASEAPDARARLLEEALTIWSNLGNGVHAAQVQLALSQLRGGGEGRRAATRAMRKLQAAGVRVGASGAAGLLRFVARPAEAPLRVQTLGAFRVLVDGTPVSTSAWRSKKARDLFQILIARRGRPVARELLMEMLWPEEDPQKLPHRLSVALSALRGVLDPERRFHADAFIRGDPASIALDVDNVAIDVQDFLDDAEAALFAARGGSGREDVTDLLLTAEASYVGDFLEEVYEDWAAPLREHARAVYLDVVRALAQGAAEVSDHDSAARFLLRILERDPFDERAHLGLVTALAAAGRHGDARRTYRAYCSRLEQIGVEAAPYPVAVDGAADAV